IIDWFHIAMKIPPMQQIADRIVRSQSGPFGGLIAAELGDVHEQQVWRFLRQQRLDLDGKKSWCESDDPEFAAKAADVVGLYMAPPHNAVVLCIDEKPSIQALERAQGYLKLPNGRSEERRVGKEGRARRGAEH